MSEFQQGLLQREMILTELQRTIPLEAEKKDTSTQTPTTTAASATTTQNPSRVVNYHADNLDEIIADLQSFTTDKQDPASKEAQSPQPPIPHLGTTTVTGGGDSEMWWRKGENA